MLCSLLGELRDGILAVGLDDGVGIAVLHDKSFEMLALMFVGPFLLVMAALRKPVMVSTMVRMVMFLGFSVNVVSLKCRLCMKQ